MAMNNSFEIKYLNSTISQVISIFMRDTYYMSVLSPTRPLSN